MDTSLRDEIAAVRRKDKTRLKYYIAASVLLVALATTGIMRALKSGNNQSDHKPVVTSSNQATTSSAEPKDINAAPNASTTPTSKPTPVASSPATPAVDIAAANAKLCKSIIDNAKSASDQYNKMYFDAWNKWNDTYYGAYDSPDAIDNKTWYKNYFKGLYNGFISQNSASYNKACGSGGSVADVVYQPNYDAW